MVLAVGGIAMSNNSVGPTVYTSDALEIVRRMKRMGQSGRQIADRLGSTERSVAVMASRIGAKKRYRSIHTKLTTKTIDRYKQEARRRNQSLYQFLRRVLTTIDRENLFTAIIDDGK